MRRNIMSFTVSLFHRDRQPNLCIFGSCFLTVFLFGASPVLGGERQFPTAEDTLRTIAIKKFYAWEIIEDVSGPPEYLLGLVPPLPPGKGIPASIGGTNSIFRLSEDFQSEDLRYLRYFPEIKHVTLENAFASDPSLLEISQCHQITKVTLVGGSFTNRGITYLRSLPKLAAVSLSTNNASDVSIDGLTALLKDRPIEYLRLEGAFVTNDLLIKLSTILDCQVMVLCRLME